MTNLLLALGGTAIVFIFLIIKGSGSGWGEIATYASNAGFSGEDLIFAVAVALAESGGNPNAYNPETAAGAPEGKGSYGLWQIYLHAHPEFEGQDLFDPEVNANAAYQVYVQAGRRFTPWSTFKNAAYVSKLDEARKQVPA